MSVGTTIAPGSLGSPFLSPNLSQLSCFRGEIRRWVLHSSFVCLAESPEFLHLAGLPSERRRQHAEGAFTRVHCAILT
jgi:hypothetical protein